MQPIYMTGHQRPVHKVVHNLDGDLLFSCSDDGKVCMYNTHQCVRTGVFEVKEAVTSIAVTLDSKYLIAAAMTTGFIVFNVADGRQAKRVETKALQNKQVSLSFGDKQLLVLFDLERVSHVRVYDMNEVLREDAPKHSFEIKGTRDATWTHAKWYRLNKSIIVSTNTGQLIMYDLASKTATRTVQVHKAEIFKTYLTHDFTMLVTCSRDGNACLVNPETFEVVRTFVYGKPVRSACISPLFEDPDHQKFDIMIAGGQDAKDVTTTTAEAGGFEMKLFSIFYNEKLAEIHGHFGPVHSIDFSPDGRAFASGAEDGYVHYHQLPPEYFSKKFE